jgi:hypothetical protein
MAQKKSTRNAVKKLQQGGWLYELLGADRKRVAEQPTDAAIKRIQARLFAEMEERQEKAAA